MMRIIYVTESGAAYGVFSGSLSKLADDWSEKTDAEKETIFSSADERGIAPMTSLATLGAFTIHVYTTEENAIGVARPVANGTGAWIKTEKDGGGAYSPHCFINAVPLPQVVLPRRLLPLAGVASVEAVAVEAILSGSGAVRIAVTTDLEAYRTYNFTAEEWEELDITDTAAFLADGIPASSLVSVPAAAWAELGMDGLGFAYCLDVSSAADQAKVSELKLALKMVGRWDAAKNGTDYLYGYTSPTRLSVTFLRDGSFKVNYLGAGIGEVVASQEPIGVSFSGEIDVWNYIDTKGDNL